MHTYSVKETEQFLPPSNSPWTTQHPVFILLSLLLIIATNEVESASYNICLRTRESGALLE